MNITGRILLKKTLEVAAEITEYRLDTSELQKDVFFLVLKGKKDVTIQKLFMAD